MAQPVFEKLSDADELPDFDEVIDRRGTMCSKWDDMRAHYPVPQDGLAMWVADMDFRPPAGVTTALQGLTRHGIYGYPGANTPYLDAIRWWMANRHGWDVPAEAILSTHGLVNAIALAVQAYTRPDDAVIVTTPVYHAFARIIRAAGRTVTELPLASSAGRYTFDWPAWEAMLTGRERMFILCSPHNPGGRVWSKAELREVADFCTRHDLILISDEIHHDLVLPGSPRHHVTETVAPDIADRLVTLTAATKTFNIAGAYLGNAIITDPDLRARFEAQMMALGISPGLFGMPMVTAAYSPEGAAWVDALTAYLDGNRRLFDAGVNAIPGLVSMPLEATYLAWVDLSGTGMTKAEFIARIEGQAGIAANHGSSFGTGGEAFMRFNLGTTRTCVAEAVQRLQAAFADLQ